MYWFDYVSFLKYILEYMFDEMESTCKSTFTEHQTRWLTQRKDLVQLFELRAEPAALTEYHFYLKKWLAKYGFTDVDIQQTFSL